MQRLEWLRVLRGGGNLPLVLSCEHAWRWLPPEYGTLGLPAEVLGTCPDVYDLGAAEIFAALSAALGCDGIESRLCRLLIDLNRYLEQDTLIPRRCGDVDIPGNADLPAQERRRRIERYYLPYQRGLLELLQEAEARHGRAFLVSVHTMAAEHFGQRREMDFALICNRGCPVAGIVAARLQDAGWNVRLNDPFRPVRDVLRVPGGHAAERFNARAVLLEVNDRLRDDPRVPIELEGAIRAAVASSP